MHNEVMEHERPHKKIRHFNKMPYRLHGNEIMTKAGAEGMKTYLQNRGYLVRVVKEPHENEWLIYCRRK